MLVYQSFSRSTILFQIENISTTIGWTALKCGTDVRALAHHLLYLSFFFCVAGKLNPPKSNPNEKENFLHITSILIYQISLMFKSQTPFSRHKSHRETWCLNTAHNYMTTHSCAEGVPTITCNSSSNQDHHDLAKYIQYL